MRLIVYKEEVVNEKLFTAKKFDGSESSDPDDAAFNFAWYEGTNLFSTNVVASRELKVGAHEITLKLDDTFPLGTSSTQRGGGSDLREGRGGDSGFPGDGLGPLQARPAAATSHIESRSRFFFERGQFKAGCNQLRAFQNKVNAQVNPADANLAGMLIQTAQGIIAAVGK